MSRRVSRALLSLVALALMCLSNAQDSRYAIVYDLKSKEASTVLGYKLAEFKNFLGKGLTAEGWGLAAYGTQTKATSLGMALVVPYRAADNLTLYGGGTYKSGAKGGSFGLIVGVSFAIR